MTTSPRCPRRPNVVIPRSLSSATSLGPFVARCSAKTRFFRSLVPLFGAVEVLRCNGHGTHP